MSRFKAPTVVIIAATAALFIALFAAFAGADRTIFTPSLIPSAHARFAAGCKACHEPWKGAARERCLDCHQRTLDSDTHSTTALASPKKAVLPENLRHLDCVNCHREHRPASAGLYTGPSNMCVLCHEKQKIDATHGQYADNTCQKSGCHSYHFNVRSQDFAGNVEERLKPVSEIPLLPAKIGETASPKALEEMRNSVYYKKYSVVVAQYEIGAHNGTRATCARCHELEGKGFVTDPGVAVCKDCHENQTKTFIAGRHGSPDGVSAGFAPSAPAKMGCGACHDVHSVSLTGAAISACAKCHADQHSESYFKSGHYRYLTDPVYSLKPAKGAACATCHMPRAAELGGYTDHNETHSTSTKERTAMTVCARCHGLQYSLMGVFDAGLVKAGFTFTPAGPLAEIASHFPKSPTP